MAMDHVGMWITQIIIFILLANIIELLIPKTTMKKYIKLIIGLILILIFLKPLFYMFTIDITNELETSLTRSFQSNKKADQIENLTELQIREIQASQDAYILEQLSIQLKELAQKPLRDEFQVQIAEMDYLFAKEGSMSYEDLTEVTVYIHGDVQGEGDIRVIDEISILQEPTTEDDRDYVEIENRLVELWELDDVALTIKWR